MSEFRINIQVDDESSLYNSFDAEKQTLSADLIDYISNRYTDKHFHQRVVLGFSGAEINAVQLKKSTASLCTAGN